MSIGTRASCCARRWPRQDRSHPACTWRRSIPSRFCATDLDRFDVVLLCNVPPPDEVAAGALNRYVRAGGGLAIFLGSEVGDPAEFNRVLDAGRSGVLPAPLESLVSRPVGAVESDWCARSRTP